MDIFNLLNIRRPGSMPVPPSSTLASITKKLNGGAEDPDRVSEACTEIGDAISAWTAHSERIQDYRSRAVVEGLDGKKRIALRDAEEIASEELRLLRDGEGAMRLRLDQARAAVRNVTRTRHTDEFFSEFDQIAEQALALSERASQLVKRAETLDLDNRLTMMAAPILAFLSGWLSERRSDIDAARATFRRARFPEQQPSAPAPVPKPVMPTVRTQEPRASLQHPVTLGVHDRGGYTFAPRIADDLSPLKQGEVRCVVFRAGFQAPAGMQCRSGQKIKLPREVATEAARNGAVEIVESHVGLLDDPDNERTFHKVT